jgi:pilus assembly protein CpaF
MMAPSFGRRRIETPDTPQPAASPARAQEVSVVAPPTLPAAPPPRPTPPASSPLSELRNLCLLRIDPASVAALPPDRLAPEVERLIAEIANERRIQLNGREQHQLATELVRDMLGLGPLDPLLADDSVGDILVNGPHRVFIERKGRMVLSDTRFRDAGHVANICQRIASSIGRRVDESSPMCDARLADGSRVNIVFPPLALDGPYLSIRKFAAKRIDFAKLVEFGSCPPSMARILEIAGRARLNLIISGGTGSGKTTLLNAISRMIDPGERVVTIEDAAELQLQQPHVVRLETRPASLEGRGEITQRDLLRNALRMRPDRVIVGEVRAGEAFDMLQAMNTGHDGSMSTVHANTARDAISRIENMVQMGNLGLPARAIRNQIMSAVDLIIQIERQRDGKRRITQLTDVQGMEGDVVTLNDIFKFEVEGEGSDGQVLGAWKVNRARPSFHARLAYFQLERAWASALENT